MFNIALTEDFLTMLVRLAVCIAFNWFIVDRLYFTKSHRRDYYFTFTLISIAIFLLVFFMIFVLEDLKAKTSIGIGIGLFGIFSIMRYRTDTIPVREMTYLFVIIALSVINAIANTVTIAELLLTNAIVVFFVWLCERHLKIEPSRLVQYDRIELITPERREDLIADLEKRLGVKVKNVEVGAVDFLRDMAMLRVYYEGEKVGCVSEKQKLTNTDLKETGK